MLNITKKTLIKWILETRSFFIRQGASPFFKKEQGSSVLPFLKKGAQRSPNAKTPRSPNFAAFGRLLRWRIALAAACSGLAGYAAAGGHMAAATPLFLSLFALAAACSALNQAQEAGSDALWPRTATRPLPTGEISKKSAMLTALLLALAALAGLALISKALAALGLVAIILYNGIYTPLKSTGWPAFAVGSAVGAMPPLFGWLATGKSLDDPFLSTLLFVLFSWQFPHVLLRGIKDAARGAEENAVEPEGSTAEEPWIKRSSKTPGPSAQRPPIPDWPETGLLLALRMGLLIYALSLALLSLAGSGFALPVRLLWLILAASLLIPFQRRRTAHLEISRREHVRNVALIDGTLLLAMLPIIFREVLNV